MDSVKTGQIDITPIHDMECTRLYVDLIEDVHIVNLSMGDNDHRGDTSPEIEKRVKLDCPFAFSEFCPWEERQAKIDGS